MSIFPQRTPLAELLAELDLSQADLARRSRTSLSVIARAMHGEQISAAGRARIVAAINARRAEAQQPELATSDIFPMGVAVLLLQSTPDSGRMPADTDHALSSG